MLVGVAAAVSFHTACRFFSGHTWDADRIGLARPGLRDQPGGQQREHRERRRPAKRGTKRIQHSTPRGG